jgi:hypothetical protein
MVVLKEERKVEQLELTDEQLEVVVGGNSTPIGINLNLAVAPQIDIILFSKLIDSSITGANITQLNGLTQTTKR